MSQNLPMEVIGEILKRLPVKSVIRCRLVCTDWDSLITDPSFITAHLQTALSKPHTQLLLPKFFPRGRENYTLRFYNDDFHEFNQLPFPGMLYFCYCRALSEPDTLFEPDTHLLRRMFFPQGRENYALCFYSNDFEFIRFPVPEKPCSCYFLVLGSCNGLVVLRSPLLGPIPNLIFWNPSIHKYIRLPEPGINCTSDNAHLIYGFGFDSRINDYKLVTVVLEKNKILREAYLFSLNENSWKRVTASSPKYAVDKEGSSAFVNGAIHWMGYQRGEDGGYWSTILGFDISTEEFFVIGLPDSLIDCLFGFSPWLLSVMKYEESSIAVLKNCWYEPEHLVVWVMKEYGAVESWTKVLHFTEQSEMIPRVLWFRKNEVLLRLDGGEMASLELESQQMEHLGIMAEKNSFVDSYVESLVLLDK